MQKLSLEALKKKADLAISSEIMDAITGGNKADCHCDECNRDIIDFDDGMGHICIE